MPFFSEETLQAVRSIPLHEIVRPHVELSRSGRNWRGLSPFTQEKSPSFFVLTEKNYFKCHSSGLAGDGIRFLQETEKLTFPEAVETLAERFNIPIKYASGKGPDPEIRSLKQALYDIHEYAREYYHHAFKADNAIAEGVRRYWVEERGFSLELADSFQIGLSPPDSRKLLDFLKSKGFKTEALAESGLFHTGRATNDSDRWFFVFRGRLMIPIRDLQGQVVAFTARQLELTPKDHASWKAKYINSPETPIFRKGHLLFNLHEAREAVKSADRILMVEGQLDALRCWDCGLKEAVAPQGTSVTEDQLALIKRYTDQLDVFLDSDEAGSRAILRLLPMALKNRLKVTVIQLPEGEDPDDFLRAKGSGGLNRLDSLSGVSFAGKVLLGGGEPGPEDRSKALEELFKIISACESAVVRDGYFEEAVAVAGVSRQSALEDFSRFTRQQSSRVTVPAAKKKSNKGTNSAETLTNLEGDLVWAVLQNVAWAEPLAQVIDHQWIKSSTCEGKILSLILAQATVDHFEETDDILLLLETDEERDCFANYLVEDRTGLDMFTFVNTTLASMARRYCRERIHQLNRKISEIAENPEEFSKIRTVIDEKNELVRHVTQGSFPEVSLPE